ncbi:helix-turn-helix transcriptional regulator [Tessaracoccus sp. MC1627]|uniref:helix-turn-helix domain-containing protein n=1 Tax=Tessaracoccus sp. MC1627 TaxID=2760312 RepID=UPI00160303BA|nr:helix-turn-helix transcriptional regulator [Tessaracoccus sp. MC1627]MBB1512023.1 helix-turn-helix transcriptional regulator [Tessaracoccus sp. MC1627]
MTWTQFVRTVATETPHAEIGRRIGITGASVGRWFSLGSLPDPQTAAKFARAFRRPVLEAFVAAGFLTADEAGEQPTAPPSLATLSDDDLIEEVRRRMTGGSHGLVDSAQKSAKAAVTPIEGPPVDYAWSNELDIATPIAPEGEGDEPLPVTSPDDVALAARRTRSRGKQMQAEADALGEESQDLGGTDPA